jgi:hypothetical protein
VRLRRAGNGPPKTATEDTSLSQRERFEQSVRELGVDLDEEMLKEALRAVAKHRTAKDSASKLSETEVSCQRPA